MIVTEKIRGFICTTAHPVGCEENVRRQIEFVKNNKKDMHNPPKKVLVLGSGAGYGLASRISAAFGMRADTIGVSFERPGAGVRCASAGWYNTAAFQKYATEDGLAAYDIMGDAFTAEIKNLTADLIKEKFGQIDLLVYSIASPRRTMADGSVVSSALKPIGAASTAKSIDTATGKIKFVTLEAAAEGSDEIASTVTVMGGEDWADWVSFLKDRNLLADGFTTLAYDYIGPKVTEAIYRNGTIGRAKEHLEATAREMDSNLKKINGGAYVSVNKALVTQSSAAIPSIPLYISLLFKLMKKQGNHEGAIEQMHRMFTDKIYGGSGVTLDENALVRMDDYEMDADLQAKVAKIWEEVTDENLAEFADLSGYTDDFKKLFGFGFENVDYTMDVDIEVPLDLYS